VSAGGKRPQAGARYVLERVDPVDQAGEAARAAVIYRGFVYLPNADLPVEVHVALPGGAATASFARGGEGKGGQGRGAEGSSDEGEGGQGEDREGAAGEGAGAATKELLRMAAALVRSATKGASASGGAFPRKIERWRG
jgi:hypothetical protein